LKVSGHELARRLLLPSPEGAVVQTTRLPA
jgi:hypothetical protein